MNKNLVILNIAFCMAIFAGCSGNEKTEAKASFGKGDKMSKKILVAYGSFSGSTAETAIFIGKKLSEKGMQVDVKPVNKIKSIEGYNGVIIGSAIMMGKLKSSVVKFVNKNKDGLSRVPVAVFLVCLTIKEDTPDNRKIASGFLDPVKIEIKPVSEGLFPGMVDFKKLPFPISLMTLLPAFKNMTPEGDYRDWGKVEKWVNEIASKF
jgi:menaquinone-dependent protoporphyrinogen oxidase